MRPEAVENQPLLTIAVPTYNRAEKLKVLLENLLPQVAVLPEVELLVSDNASPDDTQAIVEQAIAQGLRCEYIRNSTNIEADPNFLQCYERARGKYVWIFGDDDVLLPGSLAFITRLLQRKECDLVYVQPFGFVHKVEERGHRNPSPAVFEYSSAADFLHNAGLRGDLVMLSAVIVNKNRVEATPHPAFREGYDTNLLQMGWTFTALQRLQCGLVIERGLFGVCEHAPRRGFDIVKVFGTNWAKAAQLFLAPRQDLIDAALDDQLYSWFVTNWYGMRRKAATAGIADPAGRMRAIYGHRWRFWIFTWPLLVWPMFPAGVWLAGLRLLRKLDLQCQRMRSSRL